jgi:hypothetical protein
VFPSDLPGVNPATLNGMLFYYRSMTKRSGLGDSTELSRVGLSQNKIEESHANIFCLQETKKESFDRCFIHKFAPKRFDQFDFCPSLGSSGGILVCWASKHFSAILIDKQSFAIHLALTSTHSLTLWNVVVVYGPCKKPARDQFVNWLCNPQIKDEDLWLLMGDFNFYRYAKNRNKTGAIFMIPWFSIT